MSPLEVPSNARQGRVLFVDDDQAILDSFRAAFSRRYILGLAGNAQEGLALLASGRRFDVLVTDVRMPGMSGLDFLARARELAPWSVRIVLTGHADVETAARAVNQGHVYKFLTKPCPRPELAIALEEALRHGRGQSRLDEQALKGFLSALHFRNLETSDHVERVGSLSRKIALAMAWNEEDADLLRMAATLHDIGKIGIPDAVLLKPGRLSAEEFGIMKHHPGIGREMLKEADSPLLRMARDVAAHHHERPDGAGYPEGLRGKDIPVGARIVAVADVYDALISDRVYRPRFPRREALEIISGGGGTAFDPDVVAAFQRIV
ncbi:Cyclic di-GMP phosphodiesterase response regulator RpfG [Fundidesulfovibrio magnetotacticus]|uniref:Cyclic di-GMP phosphodiesterase response regulator RpfG n=1 Tax=Fundidesulfovibrio magnetotacticus TaxID=2730080 RepID=A0A6V8LJL0_9BACT|nr:HD domain-containing phosphohydrolase [Fundidesulfovibrio magnetotacticus]GFK92922.1 Cyclic di-GMP phosphodiesterase response regulator RpfG [Fundidesulfovibrio magnetotacticus]